MKLHRFKHVIKYEYSQKCSEIREPSTTYSYIWHVDILKSVKVWWRYNTSDMNDRQLCVKIPKKNIMKSKGHP